MHSLVSLKKWAGFTLLELIITVVIIGILSAIGIPAYEGYVQDSKIKSAIVSMKLIASAEETFRFMNGVYYSSARDYASVNTYKDFPAKNDLTCTPSNTTTATLNGLVFSGFVTLNTDQDTLKPEFYFCTYVDDSQVSAGKPPQLGIRAVQNSPAATTLDYKGGDKGTFTLNGKNMQW